MGGNALWNFRRQGGLKHGSRPWLGMDIFWNCPITDFPTLFKTELRFLIPCLRHLKLQLQEVVWLSCYVINGNFMCLVSKAKVNGSQY